MAADEKKLIFDETPRTCSECGGKYKFDGRGAYTCVECGHVTYDDFGKIRMYIDVHGPSPAVAISEGTGVPVQKINRYLRQGRIEIPDGSGEYIGCERCGEPIRYGRYCPACAAALSKSMSVSLSSGDIGEKPKFTRTGKMHTENLLRRREK